MRASKEGSLQPTAKGEPNKTCAAPTRVAPVKTEKSHGRSVFYSKGPAACPFVILLAGTATVTEVFKGEDEARSLTISHGGSPMGVKPTVRKGLPTAMGGAVATEGVSVAGRPPT